MGLLSKLTLIFLALGTSFIQFFYSQGYLSAKVAQTSAIICFTVLVIYAAIYLYFDMKNIKKRNS